MKPMMAYCGDKLFNFVLKKVHNLSNDQFNGNGQSNGINYSYEVVNAPTGRFVSNELTHNLEINLTVKVKVALNGNNFDQDVPMKATGRANISGGVLSITQLSIANMDGGIVSTIVTGIINNRIIPPLRNALRNIPLPQLNNLFGSGFSVITTEGAVIPDGPSFESGFSIVGVSGVANSNRPSVVDLTSLNNAASNRIIAVVSDDAIQVLSRNLIPEISQSFDKSAIGGAAKIKGKIKAKNLKFDIAGGVGRVKMTILISRLKGGIKAPFIGWRYVNIPCPNVDVLVTNSISVSGNRVIITLTGVDNVSIDLDFPALLSPAESLLEGLFNTILRAFHRRITDAIEGTRIEIFRLSPNLFDNSLSANLAFEPAGVRYVNNSAQVTLRVS